MFIQKKKVVACLIIAFITVVIILFVGLNNNDVIYVQASSSKDQNIVDIDVVGIQDFTDVKYIENANYFKVNPKHAVNDGSDNSAGTCTTVAVQLLLGYHNYYSDRRLIPAVGEKNRIFLDSNYGNINDNPIVNSTFSSGQGRASIGTEDGVYQEIFDLTEIASWGALGQSVAKIRQSLPQTDELKIVGALYRTDSGVVEFDL